MKKINISLLVLFMVSLFVGYYLIGQKNKSINRLEEENSELRVLKDSTISLVVNTLALSDSLRRENEKIQAGKDSLQLYFNLLEVKLTKKEKEYEKLVNDTANIRELFDYLSKHLFTD